MATSPRSARISRWDSAHRSLEKALQGLARLQQLVSQPRLGLRNSPPHLPSILPQMHQHLRLIREQYGASLAQLWEGEYFRVYLTNLLAKLKQGIRLFKKEKEEIYQEGSTSRRDLTKLSLIFSHMLAELQALFPDGKDQGSTYRFIKPEAQSFWRSTWGGRNLVSWAEFREGLHQIHPLDPGPMAMALRSTIDLTCNGHISIFEFDIFTRLFQPWPTLLKNWTYLAVTHPGYMAFLTYDEVKARLQAYINKPGRWIPACHEVPTHCDHGAISCGTYGMRHAGFNTETAMDCHSLEDIIKTYRLPPISMGIVSETYHGYLKPQITANPTFYLATLDSSGQLCYIFRLSCTRLGQWAIGYVTESGSILQTIPNNKPLFQALISGYKEGCYLYPDGKNVNPDLTELTEVSSRNRIQVSQEQFELYCQVGSTFQLCKICAENDKNVRIQPCGHLLCRGCLDTWQLTEAHTCPFCRREISGHENVLIDPFTYKEDDPTSLEEEGDDGDLEDVASVLQELALMRREREQPTGATPSPSPSPCPEPELQLPPLPPRRNIPRPNPDSQGSLSARRICDRPLPPPPPQDCPSFTAPWDIPTASPFHGSQQEQTPS